MPSVALVLDRFDPLGGGLERWVHQLGRYLIQAGYEVHVVTFDLREPVDSDLVLHRLPKSSSRLARAEAVERFLKQLKVDIVHDMGVSWSFDILQPHAGSKLANYHHDLQSQSPWERLRRQLSPAYLKWYWEMRILERRQYTSSKGLFIAISKMVQTHLQWYYKVDSGRVRFVYNGVDVNRFSPKHRMTYRDPIRKNLGLEQEVLFLFVGNNFRLKGLRTALKAMRFLKKDHQNAHLAIVGGGPIESYRKIAKRLRVGELVTFCGFIENPTPYYMAADVLIHPTFYDTCSLVVLEAWASGLPVITTRFNGAGELMTPGIHGFLMENPNDDEALAMKMRSLLDDSLRFTMAKESYALGLNQSIEKNFQGIEKVYQEIS
jgi:UDP-glucose:(heptosyl)LPS alpha-1,3-glucosyltransferase